MQEPREAKISILAVEGSTDARFYRVILYGLAATMGCNARIVDVEESRLSALGSIAATIHDALREARRILPKSLHYQLKRNILLAECGKASAVIPVVAFGGGSKLLGYLARVLKSTRGARSQQAP